MGTSILWYKQKPNLEKLFRFRDLEEETKLMKHTEKVWSDAKETKSS